MFGFKKGAFTGTGSRKLGMFDLAHEGTIFLDEIGDMSLALQAKILRVVEDGQVYRIGETEPVNIDVRVMVAINRNLKKLCDEGWFRQDLHFLQPQETSYKVMDMPASSIQNVEKEMIAG